MLRLFIIGVALLATLSYAWSRNGTGYYNSHNFTVGPNGMVKATPKFQSARTGPSQRREK
jgi:hypothetical protein